MSTTNDVTGDALVSKPTTDAYAQGWDRIFGRKPTPVERKDLEDAIAEDEAFKALETKE